MGVPQGGVEAFIVIVGIGEIRVRIGVGPDGAAFFHVLKLAEEVGIRVFGEPDPGSGNGPARIHPVVPCVIVFAESLEGGNCFGRNGSNE
jgi:hypothetical protein